MPVLLSRLILLDWLYREPMDTDLAAGPDRPVATGPIVEAVTDPRSRAITGNCRPPNVGVPTIGLLAMSDDPRRPDVGIYPPNLSSPPSDPKPCRRCHRFHSPIPI